MSSKDEIFLLGAEYFCDYLKENVDDDGYILGTDLDILLNFFNEEQKEQLDKNKGEI